MELKQDVPISWEQARQLIRELAAYEFAVRDMVRFNLNALRQFNRPPGRQPPKVRALARMPGVPASLKEMLE